MADRYWVNDDADNDWSVANNWSSSDGGAGGAGIPTATDDVHFTSSVTDNCTLSANAACLGFTMATGYSGTFDANDFDIDIDGDFLYQAGSILCGSGTWTFLGHLQRLATAITDETSTWVLAGTTKNLNIGSFTLYNVTVTGSYTGTNNFGELTIANILDVQGTLTLNNQGITINGGSLTVSGTLNGTETLLIQNGSITANSGTISCPIIMQSNAATVRTIPAGTYNDLSLRAGGSVTPVYRFGAGTLDCVDLSTATWFGSPTGLTLDFATNNPDINISGDVSIHNAYVTWSKGTGTLTIDGSGAQDLDFNGETVEDMDIDKSANTATLSGDVDPDSLVVSSGTLDIDGNNITTTGNVTIAAATAVNDTTGGGLITVGGNFAINGTSGNEVTWNGPDLDITGTAAADYATVTNSDASAGTEVTASNSTDNGGNSGWNFGAASSALLPMLQHHEMAL